MSLSSSRKVGVDFGTSRTRIWVTGKGVVFDEPSILVRDKEMDELIFLGKRVKEIQGRTPGNIEVHNVITRGAITNQQHAIEYMRHAIAESTGFFSFLRKNLLIGIPTGISNIEQRTMFEVFRKAGAKNIDSEDSALLAAFGVGIKQDDYRAWMVVDIGAGLTEIGIISFGGLGENQTIKVGGIDMDSSIVAYVRAKYKLDISMDVAENAKNTVGSADMREEGRSMQVRGSDVLKRLPRTITITSKDIAEAVQPELKKIVDAIASVFQETPPEVTSDVIERGIMLVGGVAQLQGLDILIREHMQTNVHIADDPINAVILGIGQYLDAGHDR